LDWLEKRGNGIGVLHDDDSRWVCTGDGFQPLSHVKEDGTEVFITDEAIPGVWSFVVAEAKEWKPSIREAIDNAMQEE
jgi:hypothetical protein